MKGPRLRALVLTAGLGTRLRPLTLALPKALLPICGAPLVSYTLRQLAGLGCESAALNLHHLPDAIPEALGESFADMPLVYSRENPVQGTLGALHPLREHLADADLILLVNGDSLCRWPWKRLIQRHRKQNADATLLVHHRSPDPRLGGGVGVDSDGRVVNLRDMEPCGAVAKEHVFAGAHILSPRMLERVAEGPGDIISGLYQPLLQEGGHIASYVMRSRWHDLGTPSRYLTAALDAARGIAFRRNWISPEATLGEGASVRRSVIESGAQVGENVQIEESLILPDAHVAAGSRIRQCILGPGVVLNSAANVERRMITRVRVGYQARDQETVLGELVYTPLDEVTMDRQPS